MEDLSSLVALELLSQPLLAIACVVRATLWPSALWPEVAHHPFWMSKGGWDA